jgi:hypothetical protein
MESSSEESSSDEELSREYNEKHMKYYKQYTGQEPVNNEFLVKLFTRGSPIKRKVELKTNCMCGDEMKACKCNVIIERTPVPNMEEEDWKLTCNVDLLYPTTPLTMQEITPDKKFMCRVKTVWGPKSQPEAKMTDIKITAEQSPMMEQIKEESLYHRLSNNPRHIDQFKSLFSPVAQYKHTLKYSLLDEIKVDVDFKLTPIQKSYFNYWYLVLKNKYFSQSQVTEIDVNNPMNKLMIKLNIDPVNRRYLNVTVKSPREETKLFDLPLFTSVKSLNMAKLSKPSKSFYQFFSQIITQPKALCEVRTDMIKTFDEVKYNVPTSTCYSVLAKDCHSKLNSKFAVLLKKMTPTSEKKILKIVTPTTKLVIKATNNPIKPECELNGNKKSCDQLTEIIEHSNHVVLSCHMVDSIIRCTLPEAGIVVYFDGFAANIKVSPIYRNHVCGLCGHFDSLPEVELMNAQYEQVDRREMFNSYLIQQGNCEHTWQPQPMEPTFEIPEIFDELPESIRSPYRKVVPVFQPVEKTKVMEEGHEICFSKTPVMKCPKHTYPIEHKTTPVKIVYTCMPRNDYLAEQLLRRSHVHWVLSEVENLPGSYTFTETVPKTCKMIV